MKKNAILLRPVKNKLKLDRPSKLNLKDNFISQSNPDK